VARPLRIEFEGALYHLLARGNDQQAIYERDADRERFLSLLAESAGRFDVAVHCFVLMGNHFHLLAQTRRANLSRWMHWLMVAYTVYFNRRRRRSGHLLQGRYKSFVVEEGEYLLALSRYIHLNPVRGLALGRGTPKQRQERLRKFRWSSYPGYGGLDEPWAFIEEELVWGELGGAKRGRKLRYRRFVEEGLVSEIENPFEAVRWQTILGSEDFGQKVWDRMRGGAESRREMKSGLRRARPIPAPGDILALVGKKYGVSPERLLGRIERGLAARNVAMWLVWECCELSLAQIGKLFGGLDYAAVAQRIRRMRRDLSPTARNRLIAQMSNVKI
jgi:putative transposase